MGPLEIDLKVCRFSEDFTLVIIDGSDTVQYCIGNQNMYRSFFKNSKSTIGSSLITHTLKF